MDDIVRSRGSAKGRNRGTAYGNLVWAVAVSPDKSVGLAEQTRLTLAEINSILKEFGTSKARLLNATVYVHEMHRKDEMDKVWNEWIGPDPSHWPQRACVGVTLAQGTLVEIVVLAAR